MTDNQQRRDFLKTATATAAGLAAGAMAGERRAEAQKAVPLNPAGKAVLPDGRKVDRKDILNMLGLDPNTAADGWLTIFCGVNAGALKPQDAKRLLDSKVIDRSMLTPTQLKDIQQIRK